MPAQAGRFFHSLSEQVSRLMDGNKVDVVLVAPNLPRLPIHDVALREGQPL